MHGTISVGQRAVALRGQLRQFVFDGEQIHKELACLGVGIDHNTLLLIGNVGMVFSYCVYYRGINTVHGLVLRVVHYLCRVVAFQFQHHQDTVAYVVAAERETYRQRALVVTACNAPYQAHLGLVPHPQPVHIARGGEQAVAVYMEETAACKTVSVHHGLHRNRGFGYLKLEVPRRIGLYRVARRVGCQYAVDEEMRTPDRYCGTPVQHTSRKTDCLGIDKVNACCLGTFRV